MAEMPARIGDVVIEFRDLGHPTGNHVGDGPFGGRDTQLGMSLAVA